MVFPNLEITDSLAQKLDDSKKLTAAKRESLFDELHASNAIIGCGMASVEEIDTLNILRATFLAMRRARSFPSRSTEISAPDRTSDGRG